MSHPVFNNLCSLLHPILRRNSSRSRSLSPISVTIIVASGLRYLGGGKVCDIRHIFGMSLAEAYHSIECFIDAVNVFPGLDITLPQDERELETIRLGFHQKSSSGLMFGCVGAIDGFFQPIYCPMKKDVKNTNSFYSGHYESHGINCQAMCEVRLRFLYFGVVAPA